MENNNKELDEILDKMKDGQNREDARRLTELLSEANVFIPAKFPDDTNPEIVEKVTEVPMPIPEGVEPQPCVLINKNGERFFPIFTSEEELAKGKQFDKHPLTLNVPFKSCVDIIVNAEDVEGAVINPFNQNVIMDIKQAPQPRVEGGKVTVTEEQLHSILRQKLEARELPKKLFEDGKAFIDDITSNEGEYLTNIFEELYKDTTSDCPCPYTPDDFEFMNLSINDNLQLTRISMPEKNLFPGNATSIFITWNPVEETSKYFAIVNTPDKEPNRLLQVNPTGKATDFGAAPEEGSELQHIITISSKLQ